MKYLKDIHEVQQLLLEDRSRDSENGFDGVSDMNAEEGLEERVDNSVSEQSDKEEAGNYRQPGNGCSSSRGISGRI